MIELSPAQASTRIAALLAAPESRTLDFKRIPCVLRSGQPGHVVLLRVEKSAQVHSIVADGTWTRMDASNRQLTALETSDLSYQPGVRSAASEVIPVSLDLLDTPTWRIFIAARGFKTAANAEQLQRRIV